MAERYPGAPHHRRSRTRRAQRRVHRGAGRASAGLGNVEVVTARHERLRPGDGPLRPRRLGRDVRAHAQLRRSCSAAIARWLRARRARSSCTSSRHRELRLPLRDRGRRRLDGAALLHRRHHALRRPAAPLPRATCCVEERWRGRRHALRAHRRGLAREPRREPATRSSSSSARTYGAGRRAALVRAGASSSWPAPSCSPTAAGASGSCPTTCCRRPAWAPWRKRGR